MSSTGDGGRRSAPAAHSGRVDGVRRLRDLLRAGLMSGAFAGGRLPDERQLMRSYGVSRSAVRDALALLQAARLIERCKGQGTLVVSRKNVVRLSESHGVGDPEPGSLWSGRMRVRLLDWADVPLPAIAANRLGAAPGERSLRVDYVAVLDGSPLGVATNYLRYPEAASVRPDLFRTDWYAMCDAAGLSIGSTTFVWEAALADELDRELLEIPIGDAIMLGEQVIYAPDGRAYDFAFTRARGDRTAMFSRAARRNPAERGGT